MEISTKQNKITLTKKHFRSIIGFNKEFWLAHTILGFLVSAFISFVWYYLYSSQFATAHNIHYLHVSYVFGAVAIAFGIGIVAVGVGRNKDVKRVDTKDFKIEIDTVSGFVQHYDGPFGNMIREYDIKCDRFGNLSGFRPDELNVAHKGSCVYVFCMDNKPVYARLADRFDLDEELRALVVA